MDRSFNNKATTYLVNFNENAPCFISAKVILIGSERFVSLFFEFEFSRREADQLSNKIDSVKNSDFLDT